MSKIDYPTGEPLRAGDACSRAVAAWQNPGSAGTGDRQLILDSNPDDDSVKGKESDQYRSLSDLFGSAAEEATHSGQTPDSVPLVRTAAGSLIGFAGGMIGRRAAFSALEDGGPADWVRQGIGEYFEANYEKPLGEAWNSIRNAKSAIRDGFDSAMDITDGKAAASHATDTLG